MVKIRWIITDEIENVSVEEFNSEWTGIYGYFEICVNNQELGFCPSRKLFPGEEGDEDILDWLSEFSDGIIQLNSGKKEYEIRLLSMNLAKLILIKEDKLLINFVNVKTDEIIWSEAIMLQELIDEVMLNIDKFIAEIRSINADLLRTNMVYNLIRIRKTILDLDC